MLLFRFLGRWRIWLLSEVYFQHGAGRTRANALPAVGHLLLTLNQGGRHLCISNGWTVLAGRCRGGCHLGGFTTGTLQPLHALHQGSSDLRVHVQLAHALHANGLQCGSDYICLIIKEIEFKELAWMSVLDDVLSTHMNLPVATEATLHYMVGAQIQKRRCLGGTTNGAVGIVGFRFPLGAYVVLILILPIVMFNGAIAVGAAGFRIRSRGILHPAVIGALLDNKWHTQYIALDPYVITVPH